MHRSPVGGELAELFVAEGQLVTAGDILFRINSTDAIRLAGQAVGARLTLKNAQRQQSVWPEKRDALMAKVALLDEQIRASQQDYDKSLQEGLSKIKEEQQLKRRRRVNQNVYHKASNLTRNL